MKDLKGRECSSRHFRRGNKFVPVLIPIDWKKEWIELNRKCLRSGEKEIPEQEYWLWRQKLEKSPPYRNIFHRSIRFFQALKHHFFKADHQQ